MVRWLLLSIAVSLSKAVQADQLAYPAVPDAREVGVAIYDDSGDSGESPFYWCGERLWLNRENDALLIDPANGKTIAGPLLVNEEVHSSYFGCTGEGESTVVLLDNYPRGIGWMTLDGRRGDISGVARGVSQLAYPLSVFDRNVLLAVAAEGEEPAAPGLPAGIRLSRLAPRLLRPIADLSTALSLVRIRPGLFSLELKEDQVVIEIDTNGPEAKIGRSWRLSELMPLGADLDFSYPLSAGAAIEVRAWRRSSTWIPLHPPDLICRVEDLHQTQGECHELTAEEQPLDDRISAKLPNLYLSTSPSGRWTAWGEEIKGDDIRMRVYLAPTADLLKP